MTMSKKTLLNESQVRQFMKLAKLEPLTPGFVHGLSERNTSPPGGRTSHGRGNDLDPRRRQEEGFDHLAEQPEDVGAPDVDLPGEDVAAVDVEAPEEDVGAVEVEEPEEGAPSEEEVVAALEVIARAAGLEGFDMDIEADLPAEEEEEVVEPEAPEEFAREGEDVVADMEMELQEGDEEDDGTDDLVEQITKRVAARILKSALASKSGNRVDELFGMKSKAYTKVAEQMDSIARSLCQSGERQHDPERAKEIITQKSMIGLPTGQKSGLKPKELNELAAKAVQLVKDDPKKYCGF